MPASLKELMNSNDKICVLIGDISHYIFKEIEEKYPDRFYNLGIAEQSLIGLASGMSLEGKIPIVHSIAPFVTERAYEQIKLDVAYQNTEIIIISVGGSFDYAHLGCSHHCYNDISILRLLPNLDIYVPGTKTELDEILKTTIGNGKPKYIKIFNQTHDLINMKSHKFNIINEGKDDKVLIALGSIYKDINHGFDNSTIIYSNTCTSYDEFEIEKLKTICSNKKIYTIEENNICGGFGDFIQELIEKKVKKIGIPNAFIDKYGKYEEIKSYLGLTNVGIKIYINEN